MRSMRRVGLEQGTLLLEEYQFVEEEVLQTVKPMLIGRKLYPVTKLTDAGYMSIKYYQETDMSQATISLYGETESKDKVVNDPETLGIYTIHKDFLLHWREILAGRHRGETLEAANARNAARQVAEEEDKLLLSGEYTGWPAYGIEGLASATGRGTRASAGVWPDNAFADINDARSTLQAAGYVNMPFAMIGPVAEIKKLDSLITNTTKTYRQALLDNNLVAAIYETSSLFAANGDEDSVLIVCPGKDNFDLVVGQETTTFLWQDKNMNYHGKVYEVLTPRIKRAASIVEITDVT